MSPLSESHAFPRHLVTAVLVAHDGARWLPRTLPAILSQNRPPQRLVAVDTGSKDETPAMLAEAFGASHVITRRRGTGFGAAVAYALNAYGDATGEMPIVSPDIVEWVWILHDDCEPAPDALYHLLATAHAMPAVAVVGPKVRGWYDRRQLLEVGVTISSGGRRETGLERREQDQGQHDGVRDTLAVGSAGMLIRRDVWDHLKGFDRALTLMRDDIDLGWRVNAAGHRVVVATDAVIYHAEAASRERRPVATSVHRPHLVDRANALYVLLVNHRARMIPLLLLRIILGTILRVLGALVAKRPGLAADEALGPLAALSRPDRILRGRRQRKKTRRVGHRYLRRLFPPKGAWRRHAVEAVAAVLPQRGGAEDEAGDGRHRAVETGPVSEEAESLDTGGMSVVRRALRRPEVLLVLGLTALVLVAGRGLLGSGRLMGGALLPAPDGASDLWASYLSSWHPVGVGSDTLAPPYVGIVALLGTVLLGKASLAVDLLMLGSVPLAGLTAYLAAGRVVRSRPLRLWAALTYALLPAATGAIAAGRLGTAVGLALLPLIAMGAERVVGSAGQPGTYRSAAATGLLLAVVTAFVPVAWPLAVGLAIIALLTVARAPGLTGRLALVLATPALVLLPWSLEAARHPSALLFEAGLPAPNLTDRSLGAHEILLLNPGGPGTYPAWIAAGLLLGALAALFRRSRRQAVATAWTVALVGFGAALVLVRPEVRGPLQSSEIPLWPGFATGVTGMGLLFAALIGAEGARQRIAARSFGLSQPLALGVAGLALVMPGVAAAWWIFVGAGDPLDRRDPVVLPAHVAADGASPERPRTLVLRGTGPGRVSYALLRDTGPRFGDAHMRPTRAQFGDLTELVGQIASGKGGDDAARLADYGIQYVLASRPVDSSLARTLDAVPGLVRVSAPEGSALWRLSATASRVRLVAPEGGEPIAVSAGPIGAKTEIPSGPAGRLLVLAETADDGWRATLDGEPLPGRTVDGWAQAFEVPESGGELVLGFDDQARRGSVIVQALVVLVLGVLALPTVRREDEEEPEAPVLVRPGGRQAARVAARAGAADVPADTFPDTPAGTTWPPYDPDAYPAEPYQEEPPAEEPAYEQPYRQPPYYRPSYQPAYHPEPYEADPYHQPHYERHPQQPGYPDQPYAHPADTPADAPGYDPGYDPGPGGYEGGYQGGDPNSPGEPDPYEDPYAHPYSEAYDGAYDGAYDEAEPYPGPYPGQHAPGDEPPYSDPSEHADSRRPW